MSPEDFAKFPDLGYDSLADAPSAVGDLGYEVQYNDNGTIHKYQYHGHIKTLTGATTALVPDNSIVLVYNTSTGFTPNKYSTGVIKQNITGGGTTSAFNVDGVDATTVFSVGSNLYDDSSVLAGVITAVTATTITLSLIHI